MTDVFRIEKPTPADIEAARASEFYAGWVAGYRMGVRMTDDVEDPPNDIPDEPPPITTATPYRDPEFPDDDAVDGESEDDATTTPEDPQT